MKRSVENWQFISLASRGLAMAIGLLQTWFIINYLSKEQWGIVQVALGIGASFGIYQHLGLASGTTREISKAKKDSDIYKIFIASAFIRYLITIPIALILFFYASSFAKEANQDLIILPLKLYAVVVLAQGVQSLFNAIISGTKRFQTLFIYQVIIAVASICLYVPLVYFYGINGFFYALVAFNLLASCSLAYLALKPLKGSLQLPTKADFNRLFKDLLSISLVIYLVKILFVQWDKFSTNIGSFATDLSAAEIATLAFAILYGKKLIQVSDAITDVNLPVLSEKFADNLKSYKETFTKNFDKVFTFLMFSAVSAIFWCQEIIHLVVGDKYDDAFSFIFPAVFAYLFYSLINIIKSSVLVPAHYIFELIMTFVLLIVFTFGGFYALSFVVPVQFAIIYAILLGSFISFSFAVISTQIKLNFRYVTFDHVLLLIQGFAIALSGTITILWLKGFIYLVFASLFIYAFFLAHFISKEDLLKITNKFKKFNG
jgi:O-antigen/teichoic acid export membrane protein